MSVGQTPQTATLTSSSFGADARDGDGFEAQVVDAAINDGAHGFGNDEHGKYLTQRRRDAKAEETFNSHQTRIRPRITRMNTDFLTQRQ